MMIVSGQSIASLIPAADVDEDMGLEVPQAIMAGFVA